MGFLKFAFLGRNVQVPNVKDARAILFLLLLFSFKHHGFKFVHNRGIFHR